MPFDLKRFRQHAGLLEHRTAVVPVPDLAHWFDDGEKPEWVVRGLSGLEIATAADVNNRAKLFIAAVEAFASAAHSDQVDALKALFGANGDPPADLQKRFDHLIFGSVNPVVSREDAVMLFAKYPIVAYKLTNKILDLIDHGPDMGKVPRSTDAPTS